MKKSKDVNVVYEGLPSRLGRVRRISLGMPTSARKNRVGLDDVGIDPYNHYTNYDASICKKEKIILADLLLRKVCYNEKQRKGDHYAGRKRF